MLSTRVCFIAAVALGIGLNACSRGTDNPPPAAVSSPDSATVPPPATPEKSAEASSVNPSAPPPAAPVKTEVTPTAKTPVPKPAAPRATPKVNVPAANAPVAKAPTPTAMTTTSATATPATAPNSPVPLDLIALEKQLKSTKAIGVFSKIALKNQVDDLMKKFREHYQGKGKTTMAELRQSYDLLMMKVLSMVQDNDKNLAAAIVSSRAAIWDLLADPVKFAALDT